MHITKFWKQWKWFSKYYCINGSMCNSLWVISNLYWINKKERGSVSEYFFNKRPVSRLYKHFFLTIRIAYFIVPNTAHSAKIDLKCTFILEELDLKSSGLPNGIFHIWTVALNFVNLMLEWTPLSSKNLLQV